MKKREFSVFFLLGLVCVNLVSLFLLSLLNYRFFYIEEERAFESKFRSSAAKEIESYIDSVDMQLREITQIPKLFFSETNENQSFLIPANRNIVGNSEDVRNLIADLSKIKRVYPYVYSMDIYYPSSSTAVTNFLNVHDISDKADVEMYLPWVGEIGETVINGEFLPYGIHSYPLKTNTITYVQLIPGSSNFRGDIYVALHISPSLMKNISDRGSYEVSSWVFDDGGNIIFENSSYPWQNEKILESSAKWENESVRFVDNSDGKFVLWEKQSSPLEYYGYVGYKGLYPGYSEDQGRLTKNFVIWILFNFIFLAFLTIFNYYLYKYYVGSFFKSRIRKNESLGAALKEIKEEYESMDRETKNFKNEAAVKALLTNKAEKGVYESVQHTIGSKYVCSIIVSPLDASVEFSEKYFLEIRDRFQKKYEVILTSFFYPYRVVFVVIAKVSHLPEDLISDLRKLDNSALSVGSVCQIENSGFQNSFTTAMDVFNYRFLSSESRLLTYSELNLEEKKPFGNHVNKLSQLERLIKVGDRDSIDELLQSLFDDLSNGNYSVQYVKATLADVVTSVYILLLKNKLDMYKLYGCDIKAASSRITSISEYKKWLKELIGVAVQALDDNKEKYETALSQKINRIVEEKLSSDISLSMLSDELNMREDALSRTFKSIMGSNYMEFITEKKMKKAIELLEKDMSINEIASFLGYRSAQYFIKVFKTTYGVTPNKFRKHQIIEREE